MARARGRPVVTFTELTRDYWISDVQCEDTLIPGRDPLYVVRLNGCGEWLAICEENHNVFATCATKREAVAECEADFAETQARQEAATS